MGKVVGKVTKVVKGKGIVTTPHGSFERLNLTITDNDGVSIVVQKLVKPGNNGEKLLNERVQATYTEKEVEKEDGTTFTARSVLGKDFVLLDAAERPKNFTAKPSASHNSTGTVNTPSKTGTYNPDGARHGMIVNNALTLALSRDNTATITELKKASRDIKMLTEYVEAGCPVEASGEAEKAPKTSSKTKSERVEAVAGEETNPFDD